MGDSQPPIRSGEASPVPPPRRRYSGDEATWLDGYDDFFGAADEAADGWITAEGAMDGSGAASAADEWGDNQRSEVAHGAIRGGNQRGDAPAATPPGRWVLTLG